MTTPPQARHVITFSLQNGVRERDKDRGRGRGRCGQDFQKWCNCFKAWGRMKREKKSGEKKRQEVEKREGNKMRQEEEKNGVNFPSSSPNIITVPLLIRISILEYDQSPLPLNTP